MKLHGRMQSLFEASFLNFKLEVKLALMEGQLSWFGNVLITESLWGEIPLGVPLGTAV